MTAESVIAALNLPARSRVDQRVPKRLLLENGAPTPADKRLINDGVEGIYWLAALKPATCGVPEFRDEVREYLEIAVIQMTLREQAKEARLVELLHRAVPYPVVLVTERAESVSLSLAQKRQSLKEANKVVLDGELVSVDVQPTHGGVHTAFLQALDLVRQPRVTLCTLYRGWLDTAVALQAALVTGVFVLLDSAERAQQRRQAMHTAMQLQAQIAELRRAAGKVSQMARQVELNLQLHKLEGQLKQEIGRL